MTDPTARGDRSDPLPGRAEKEERLESWGEIASFLARDIRTVQRWERDLELPVHRLKTMKHGQVYAYRSELEKWRQQRTAIAGRLDDPPASEQKAAEQDRVTHKKEEDLHDKPAPPRRRWKGVWAALGVLGLGAVVYLLWPHGQSPVSRVLLFVRPFECQCTDPSEKIFVKGLTTELITQLGRANPEALVVFAPTTSVELGGKTIPQLYRELNADYVLEGSVRRAQEQVRVDATLVYAKDQKSVWANSYTGDMRDMLKSQDDVVVDVVTQILGSLKAAKASAASGKRRPVDPEAYEAYIKGRLYWLDRDILRSRAAYEAALRTSPDFAPAQAGLAMTLLLSGQSPNDILSPRDAVPQAREAARKALASDATLGDAYCVLASIAQNFDYDPKEAERLYKKAVEVDPSNVTAHEWYGYYYMVLNHMPEAEMELEQALHVDPKAPLLNTQAAEIKYYRREYDQVLELTDKTLKLYPNFVYAHIWRASALREKKMYPEALKEFAFLRQQTNNSPASIALQAHAMGVSGDREGAMRNLQELEALKATRYVPSLYLAGVYLGVNDQPRALQKMKEAYNERYDRLIYLNVEPMADPLRGNAEFEQLMKAVGVK